MSKRVNMTLEEELHTKVKVLAALEGVTFNEYVMKAIEEALKK